MSPEQRAVLAQVEAEVVADLEADPSMERLAGDTFVPRRPEDHAAAVERLITDRIMDKIMAGSKAKDAVNTDAGRFIVGKRCAQMVELDAQVEAVRVLTS